MGTSVFYIIDYNRSIVLSLPLSSFDEAKSVLEKLNAHGLIIVQSVYGG